MRLRQAQWRARRRNASRRSCVTTKRNFASAPSGAPQQSARVSRLSRAPNYAGPASRRAFISGSAGKQTRRNQTGAKRWLLGSCRSAAKAKLLGLLLASEGAVKRAAGSKRRPRVRWPSARNGKVGKTAMSALGRAAAGHLQKGPRRARRGAAAGPPQVSGPSGVNPVPWLSCAPSAQAALADGRSGRPPTSPARPISGKKAAVRLGAALFSPPLVCEARQLNRAALAASTALLTR